MNDEIAHQFDSRRVARVVFASSIPALFDARSAPMIVIAFSTLFTSPANAADVSELDRSYCRTILKKPSTSDLIAIAKSDNDRGCLMYLADRSEPQRAILRAKNGKCTDKRVGSTARRAEALHDAGKKSKSHDELKSLAKKLEENCEGRSSMYKSCWKTMVKSI